MVFHPSFCTITENLIFVELCWPIFAKFISFTLFLSFFSYNFESLCYIFIGQGSFHIFRLLNNHRLRYFKLNLRLSIEKSLFSCT
jgi:hypothetical protein